MGHVSLYRKYRPQTFIDVVGQSHVTRTLQRAIAEDRISHAYLFSGPRGTGKTSTARILAKALNCEKGPTADPCNTCSACTEIGGGTSLDVIEYDAASHGSVDDARDIREKVAYAPVGGQWKVYIIDECHMLSAAANNALLKVLEEPPGHVVFVFATTEPQKVLHTLLDRCQRYDFRALATADIAERVAQVCDAEGIVIDEDALSQIASRAGGSMRDALSQLDQLASFAGIEIHADDVSRLLGSMPQEVLFEAVDIISERDAGAALVFADRLIRSGRDIREFVRALTDHLRSLFLVLHAPAAQEILNLSDEQLERLRAQTNRFDHAELLRLLDLANEVHLQLRQAVEGRLALEVALARMARSELHAAPASLLARIERLEARLTETGSGPAALRPPVAPPADVAREREKTAPSEALPSAPPPAPADASELDIERIKRAWDLILQKVKTRKIAFRALLVPASPVGWSDGELVLEFGPRSRFHRDQVADPNNHGPLVEVFLETFGVRPKIRCVLGEEPAAERPAAPAPGEIPAAPEEAGEEPGGPGGRRDAVDLIRESFRGAEVVEE